MFKADINHILNEIRLLYLEKMKTTLSLRLNK